MYLSSSDGVNDGNVDENSQTRQGNTPSVTSAPSPSSSPSCPTLLVIDDNSNSNDLPLNTTDIPSNSMPSNAQATNTQTTLSSPLPTIDAANDTPEQQRRRNSSIAKLLGGQPLNNQQYEEIHQQILDDQSTQNGSNNSDTGTDSGIQRSRSSITRTLLMNAERINNNNNNTSAIVNKGPPSPEFSKNFEYLIRRELDIEHAPLTLHSSSTPSVFQNLSSVRNTPLNPESPTQSKFKRKRPNSKQTIPTPPANKSSTLAPFSIREPFELDSSTSSLVPPLNPTHIKRSHHQQNDLFRFDPSQGHHRPLPPPQHHLHHPQQQQQYRLPMNSSTANSNAYPCHKLNMNSSVYTQFKLHHDRLSSTSSCSSPSSPSSYNYCRYPPTAELALPTPVSPLSSHTSSPSITQSHLMGDPSRKTKVTHRPDMYDIPIQRQYSGISNHSNVSSVSSSTSSSTSTSSGHSVPLKKRLLHAYKNEQRPSSAL